MPDTFTKLHIITALRERCGLTIEAAEAALDTVFDSLGAALAARARVELRGFGVFEPRERQAHKGRNPRTGESVEVPAQWTIKFRPGKELKAKVNEGLK